MGASLSSRQLWVVYKRTAIALGTDPRELAILQGAFYRGARGMLRVCRTCSGTATMRSCTGHYPPWPADPEDRGAPAARAAALEDELRLWSRAPSERTSQRHRTRLSLGARTARATRSFNRTGCSGSPRSTLAANALRTSATKRF